MQVAEQTNTESRPVRVQIGAWATAGWDWFVQDFWTNVLIGLLATVLISALALLTGPIFAGLANVGLRKNETGHATTRQFFDGFANFIPALLASLLIFVFALVGLIFLIVPGLVIMAMYMRPAPTAERHAGVRLSATAAGLITVSIVAVILFGLWPNGLLNLATSSARTLTQTSMPVAGR